MCDGSRDVYIGYDPLEEAAYQVACSSLLKRTKSAVIHKVDALELYALRLLWRPIEEVDGRIRDYLSDAPMSTSFSSARFVVPFLQKTGWCLFVDGDVVFLADVEELFALAHNDFALMCVQHENGHKAGIKKVGHEQVLYARKNWSSVMLMNLDHPAWHRLTLAMVNQFPRDLLHRFFWLRDSEIGALPPEWNWLVNVAEKPAKPKIAHFTLGGKFLDQWPGAEHDDIWLAERGE